MKQALIEIELVQGRKKDKINFDQFFRRIYFNKLNIISMR